MFSMMLFSRRPWSCFSLVTSILPCTSEMRPSRSAVQRETTGSTMPWTKSRSEIWDRVVVVVLAANVSKYAKLASRGVPLLLVRKMYRPPITALITTAQKMREKQVHVCVGGFSSSVSESWEEPLSSPRGLDSWLSGSAGASPLLVAHECPRWPMALTKKASQASRHGRQVDKFRQHPMQPTMRDRRQHSPPDMALRARSGQRAMERA
mmetsp:Transcript_76257/g.210445  ORF Transcript_76257/g.210445 Transcript_76257/m.210445 type:complete len:208 (-) Transcript_76257:13-636(-)